MNFSTIIGSFYGTYNIIYSKSGFMPFSRFLAIFMYYARIYMYRDISLGRCMIYGDIKYDLLINFELGPAFFISGPQVMFINRYII